MLVLVSNSFNKFFIKIRSPFNIPPIFPVSNGDWISEDFYILKENCSFQVQLNYGIVNQRNQLHAKVARWNCIKASSITWKLFLSFARNKKMNGTHIKMKNSVKVFPFVFDKNGTLISICSERLNSKGKRIEWHISSYDVLPAVRTCCKDAWQNMHNPFELMPFKRESFDCMCDGAQRIHHFS